MRRERKIFEQCELRVSPFLGQAGCAGVPFEGFSLCHISISRGFASLKNIIDFFGAIKCNC